MRKEGPINKETLEIEALLPPDHHKIDLDGDE